MKKILVFILTLVVAATMLVGCGPEESGNISETTPTPDATPTPGEPEVTPTATPTPTETPPARESFNLSDWISNPDLWNTPMMREEGFLFDIEDGDPTAVEEDGLGEVSLLFGVQGQERAARAEEWENGWIDEMLKGLREIPTTRQEAYESIIDYLNARKEQSLTGVYYSMTCAYWWHHYTAEAGYDYLGTEFSNGNFQVKLASNRGAARQYQKSWYVDMSMWFYIFKTGELGMYDPCGAWSHEEACVPDGGHSLNLAERAYIMSYMSGANALLVEGGGHICYDKFTETVITAENGLPYIYCEKAEDANLTDYGVILQKLNSFFKANSDIGTSYAPYAIILDKYHGMATDMYFSAPDASTTVFSNAEPYGPGDFFTYDIIQAIWNYSYLDSNAGNKGHMVNPNYGEMFDMLLQNASADILDTYKALILTGELNLSNEEVDRYIKYVENGGCIVMNTAYADLFSKIGLPSAVTTGDVVSEVSYGAGSFLIFGNNGMPEMWTDENGKLQIEYCGDYEVGGFRTAMDILETRYNPFEISGNIQYLINMKEDTLYLTLINNDGVTKDPIGPTIFDESCKIDLDILYRGGGHILSVKDIYNGTELTVNGDNISITVPAGGIAVLEIKVK